MPEQVPPLEPQDSPEHPLVPWFSDFRRVRRERYANRPRPSARRSRALITMVHNESVFLPIWLRFYSRFFAPQDIYVLDNETSDGSTERDGFVRIPVTRDSVDHVWMVTTIQQLQHELMDRYDVVLVTDVDEIVTPVPEWGTLGEYLDRFDEEWVNCLGYEILHMRDREPPLRREQPILDQRGYWFPNSVYDKAALATVPMSWRPGFHGRADLKLNMDPDLRLIHLHRVDYDLCLERHRVRDQRGWAERDTRKRWAIHNQITEKEDFERWFYEDSCSTLTKIKLEPIRASWRGVF